MKAVILSIQPKWCKLIASGRKTVAVCKKAPHEVPFKTYITWERSDKVIGEFICNTEAQFLVESEEEIARLAGLRQKEFIKYFSGKKYGFGLHISDLVIYDKPKEISEFSYPCKKDLPKASEQCKGCKYAFKGTISGEIYCDRTILTAPQSWCYCEELDEKQHT